MKAFSIESKKADGRTLQSFRKKVFFTFFSIAFWVGIWYLLAALIGNEIFLPYPHTVIKAWGKLVITGEFWRAVGGSLWGILIGLWIGILLGFVFSLLTARSALFHALIHPMITVLRTTPVASFIILVYVMARLLSLPVSTVSITIVTVMVIPLVYNNLAEGYRALDRSLSEVASVYHFSLGKKIKILWLPQLLPSITAALTSSLGLAWKAGISAEVICALKNTIGSHLANAKSNLDIDLLFAWTATVIVLSMGFEFLLTRLSRKMTIKRKSATISKKTEEEDVL